MRHATELYHLSAAERQQMIEELSSVAQALNVVFRPVKMNYELLGNQVPTSTGTWSPDWPKTRTLAGRCGASPTSLAGSPPRPRVSA